MRKILIIGNDGQDASLSCRAGFKDAGTRLSVVKFAVYDID